MMRNYFGLLCPFNGHLMKIHHILTLENVYAYTFYAFYWMHYFDFACKTREGKHCIYSLYSWVNSGIVSWRYYNRLLGSRKSSNGIKFATIRKCCILLELTLKKSGASFT